MRCRYCGKKYSEKLWICPKCGKVRRAGSRDKWKAFRLCLFFGWCGAHRFYAGDTIGGFYFLFTLGVFGIGWLKDLIQIYNSGNPYYPRMNIYSEKKIKEKENALIEKAVVERNKKQIGSFIDGPKKWA